MLYKNETINPTEIPPKIDVFSDLIPKFDPTTEYVFCCMSPGVVINKNFACPIDVFPNTCVGALPSALFVPSNSHGIESAPAFQSAAALASFAISAASPGF